MKACWMTFDNPIQQADATAMRAQHRRPAWFLEVSPIGDAINALAWRGRVPR